MLQHIPLSRRPDAGTLLVALALAFPSGPISAFDVDLEVPLDIPSFDALTASVPLPGGPPAAIDLQLAYDARGNVVARGPCTIDGAPVAVKGKVKSKDGYVTYSLALKGTSARVQAKIAGELRDGPVLAAISYKGPGGSTALSSEVTITSEAVAAAVTLSPTVDDAGKVGGTATLTAAYSTTPSRSGPLKGKIAGDRISLSAKMGGTQLRFQGTADAGGFVGRLQCSLPPNKTTCYGFCVPDFADALFEFNQHVQGMGAIEQDEELPEEQPVGEPEAPAKDEEYECRVARYKAAPGYNELFLLDPTSDVIFPGALLRGDTIATGEYIPIVAQRSPLWISASLINIDGSPSIEVQDPTLHSVRDAIHTMLAANVTGSTAAQILWDIQEVYSQDQLKIAVGANYSNAVVKVAGSFDFAKEEVRSRVVVKFLQVYYTIDIDLPSVPGDLFVAPPDMATLGSVSPMYVSTVTYGRMVLFTAESERSATELETAIDVAIKAGVQGGGGNIEVKYKTVIEQSSMKALVLGGSGEGAVQVVTGLGGLLDYILEGGDYSKDSPGAPLSYKLRYLKDNSIGRIVLSSEYSVRQCDLAYPQFRFELLRIRCDGCQDGDGSPGEIFGEVGAKVICGEEPFGTEADQILWNPYPDRNHILQLAANETFDIGIARVVELYRPNYELDRLELRAKFSEKDLGGWPDKDDVWGETKRIVYLKDIQFVPPGDYEVDCGDNKVSAWFKIERLK